MQKELELWQFAAARLKQNESAMLLVVARSSGSSPGRQGFKMIVAEDELCGSIGGGVMEVNLVELAKKHLRAPATENFARLQAHREKSMCPSGMICSGEQTVVFFKLDQPRLKTVREIIRALKRREPKTLWITRKNLGMRDAAGEDQPLDSIPPADFHFTAKDGNFRYEEKIGFKNKLFIVGGGHCALALSELMAKMDFYITLFDDRPDLNTLAKNRFVHEKHVIESYEKIGEFIPSGSNHFVAVMTLGYESDEIAIRKLIGKDFRYFGVLGSRAKMKTLFKNLESEGTAKEKLNRIRTPIGVPINSRTPEEIAVSIAAEIIAVKNSKN